MDMECVERSEWFNICLTNSMTTVLQKALHLMHVKLLNLVATDCDPLLMAIMRKLGCVCIEAYNPATSESLDRTWDGM